MTDQTGRAALATFVTEVVAVADVTPIVRQITFGGGLAGFNPIGGDQFMYVLLPPPGRSELTVGVDFSWQLFDELPEQHRPAGAYYSVRASRTEKGELDMWFVLHGDSGAASAWAARAQPGHRAALWGPRRTFLPPASTQSYLLVADETGFGALSAVLDELLEEDASVRVTVLAESDGPYGRVDFPRGSNVEVVWLDRAGRPPGSTAMLVEAVQTQAIDDDVYALGAGESRRITAVRKHLREVRGLRPEQVSMTGYWRAERTKATGHKNASLRELGAPDKRR